FGIDADRCESVVLAIPGNHRGRCSRIDLRVLGRKAAIEARLACRQITLARAGAKERRCRDRADARAKAQVRESKHDAGTPLPLIQPMLRPQNGGTMEMLWRSMPAAIDRRGLREEAFQDVIADGVVLLMERGVRYSRHHRELLVRVWQQLEKLHKVRKA